MRAGWDCCISRPVQCIYSVDTRVLPLALRRSLPGHEPALSVSTGSPETHGTICLCVRIFLEEAVYEAKPLVWASSGDVCDLPGTLSILSPLTALSCIPWLARGLWCDWHFFVGAAIGSDFDGYYNGNFIEISIVLQVNPRPAPESPSNQCSSAAQSAAPALGPRSTAPVGPAHGSHRRSPCNRASRGSHSGGRELRTTSRH